MAQKTTLLILLFALGGCANYTIPREDLFQQLKDNQSPQKMSSFRPGSPPGALVSFEFETYTSNGINRILCLNSDGEKVYLFPDKNTQLEITLKSTRQTVKMYFDTVFLIENKLVGLRSRLTSSMTRAISLDDPMVRAISLDDIEKVEITAEFPKTEKIQ
ncbi:MAG: hypothetical protein AUI36_46675 [Cyanobacteria bacterium 13_1_40CM_2_61_4]|nr:MAG: hypothetical protein AUI36_46675 [Cyanobacteria bacterium 13_1_40CM_2_61_4]